MIYKLSNVADQRVIEETFGLRFKYPQLYRPQPLINGFEEANLSMVTMENNKEITFAIWGLMPQNFKEDWQQFQNHANTLNVPVQDLEQVAWMKESLRHRRCAIIVSGFYTHRLKNGNTTSYYLCRPDGNPFYLAGVYNVLEDGFQCSALITNKTNNFVAHYHDISHLAPIIIPKSDAKAWLDPKTKMADIKKMVMAPREVQLKATPMPHQFFQKKGPLRQKGTVEGIGNASV